MTGRVVTGVHWGKRFVAIYDGNGHLISLDEGDFDPDLRDTNYGNETMTYDNSWSFAFNVSPQNSNNDEFTPEQLEQFKSCLSAIFKVYYDDHHYDRNGEAYFDGHSDSRAHFYNLWAIGAFRVRTDQASYSSDDLKQKFGPLAGIRFGGGIVAGFTDKRNPYVNAIANDAGVVLKGRQFLGLWVYELGNALSVITNITPEAPADANDRYGIAGEPGAAFSDCVFGGALNSNGSVRPPGH